MEIVKVDLDEIILKFKTKGSQTRHANLWLKNDGIFEVVKQDNLESIYKLKKTNRVFSWNGEEHRYICLKFNKFSVNEFISKCTGYSNIIIFYGCLLDEYTVFKDSGSRYKVVAHSCFRSKNGKYIEQYYENEKYPFKFLYNYKTCLNVRFFEEVIWIDLTFLKYHLEDWEDEQQ